MVRAVTAVTPEEILGSWDSFVERAQQRPRAGPPLGSRVERGGNVLVDARGGQLVEPALHRGLVADDRRVLRAGVALPVEHGAIRRQVAVHRELRGRLLARTIDVVGDADR